MPCAALVLRSFLNFAGLSSSRGSRSLRSPSLASLVLSLLAPVSETSAASVVAVASLAYAWKLKACFQTDSVWMKDEPHETSKSFLGGCAIFMGFVRGPPGFRAILRQGTCSEALRHRVVLSPLAPNFVLHRVRERSDGHKSFARLTCRYSESLRSCLNLCPTAAPKSQARSGPDLGFGPKPLPALRAAWRLPAPHCRRRQILLVSGTV
ncbi:hypothetical protein LCGC14_0951670 [marine sediment metagenome]|uniref:Uncharacterized protein n=1 Tax=marine sediment metagenome TaxID=412755 RepID=A0A0F9RNK5_9ZZZZ